jgi:hypothetical protein
MTPVSREEAGFHPAIIKQAEPDIGAFGEDYVADHR